MHAICKPVIFHIQLNVKHHWTTDVHTTNSFAPNMVANHFVFPIMLNMEFDIISAEKKLDSNVYRSVRLWITCSRFYHQLHISACIILTEVGAFNCWKQSRSSTQNLLVFNYGCLNSHLILVIICTQKKRDDDYYLLNGFIEAKMCLMQKERGKIRCVPSFVVAAAAAAVVSLRILIYK